MLSCVCITLKITFLLFFYGLTASNLHKIIPNGQDKKLPLNMPTFDPLAKPTMHSSYHSLSLKRKHPNIKDANKNFIGQFQKKWGWKFEKVQMKI